MDEPLKSVEFCAPFVIDEKPYCFWDENVPDVNMRFICKPS
jgi:hypothetical protein